jgi:hypothetical protein
MAATLDMDHIAKSLGAQRRGKISAKGGYFGALDLAAEVTARFRIPERGGGPQTRHGRNSGLSGCPGKRSGVSKSWLERRRSLRCRSQPCC